MGRRLVSKEINGLIKENLNIHYQYYSFGKTTGVW